jgi:hypothetical protein
MLCGWLLLAGLNERAMKNQDYVKRMLLFTSLYETTGKAIRHIDVEDMMLHSRIRNIHFDRTFKRSIITFKTIHGTRCTQCKCE